MNNLLLVIELISIYQRLLDYLDGYHSVEEAEEAIFNIVKVVLELSKLDKEDQVKLMESFDINSIEYSQIYQDAETKIENEKSNLFVEKNFHDMESLLSKEYIKKYKSLIFRLINLSKLYLPEFYNQKCLFVGSGPLPLTAIMLATVDKELRIDLLDKSDNAVKVSRQVISQLGIEDRIRVLDPIDVVDFTEFSDYECIWFAIMVGENPKEKIDILRNVAKNLSSGKRIIIRFVEENKFKSMLYAFLDINKIEDLYEIVYQEEKSLESIAKYLVLERK